MKKTYYLEPQVRIYNVEIEGLLAHSVKVGEPVEVQDEDEVGLDGPTGPDKFFGELEEMWGKSHN